MEWNNLKRIAKYEEQVTEETVLENTPFHKVVILIAC